MLQVFAIDDDFGDRQIIARSLRAYSEIELSLFESLEDALQVANQRRPDLILLDLCLPGVLGYDGLQEIHNIWGNVPVIVLTGCEDIAVYREAIQAGANDCLCKNELASGPLYRCIHSTLQRNELQEELRVAAHSDALTGLPNRSAVVAELERRSNDGPGKRRPFCLLFLDIDDFKLINDGYGHDVGDQYLLEFVKRISACLGPDDMLARFAGDEFVVVLDGAEDDEQVSVFVSCIEDSLNIPILIAGNELYTAVSIGVVASSDDYEHCQRMLLEADTAMFASKSRGKARYSWYDAEMQQEALERLAFERSLRHAIDRDELHLMYQPIVEIATGAFVGFEALMRWSPPSGAVPPLKFIPIAERTGVIHRLGRWAIETTCQQLVQWRKVLPDVSIAVNVSPVQLEHVSFREAVFDSLRKFSLPPSCLTIEITESGAIKEFDCAVGILSDLRDAGIGISVDDFGTGHSSLSQLHKLPVSEVKIDRSFVQAMDDESDYSRLFIETIHVLAGSLGLQTVAEGIESNRQRQQLIDCGYRRGQGYLFAEPMVAAAATAALQESVRQAHTRDVLTTA
ncbi:MAG: hypothetical protein Aurels2KO_29490 [Aureliella sp.]